MEPIDVRGLAVSRHAVLFQGNRHGSSVSFFVTSHPPGEGPRLHRHPYDETFLVQEGAAAFTVGEQTVDARGGQVLVVPGGTPHAFTAAGEAPLRLVSIHPAPEMQTEWLS